MNKGNRPQPTNSAGNDVFNAGNSGSHSYRKRLKGSFMFKLTSVFILFSTTIIVVALLWIVVLGGSPTTEDKYIDGSKYQAVFLINQQLPYFAKITEMNSRYVVIQDIYYLNVDQQVQPETKGKEQASNISVVKLGCELHGPQDRMVINRDQIVFWENLKDDGKVVAGIKTIRDKNPNGVVCNTAPAESTNAKPSN